MHLFNRRDEFSLDAFTPLPWASPLNSHVPLVFPINTAPKVPLKEGILKDAEQHLELLGISSEQLKQDIAPWCRGSRYWASMTENAPRS